MLETGYTAICDAGDDSEMTYVLKKTIDQGITPGARK